MGYTILRVSWYCENLLGYLPQIIEADKWPTVAGEGKIAFVPREDVARVTAAALSKETESRVYDITEVQALIIDEMAGIVEDVFGRKVKVDHLNAG